MVLVGFQNKFHWFFQEQNAADFHWVTMIFTDCFSRGLSRSNDEDNFTFEFMSLTRYPYVT